MAKRRRLNTNPLHTKIHPDLASALRETAQDLIEQKVPFIVVGGLALSYHFPTYPTDDVDFAVVSESDVPKTLKGTKRLSAHMFEMKKSGVIVDIVTPNHVKVPRQVFDYAMATATLDTSLGFDVRFATPEAIFAIKLSRGRIKDQAHIMWMMRHGFNPDSASLQAIGVPADKLALLERLQTELAVEFKEEEEMGW